MQGLEFRNYLISQDKREVLEFDSDTSLCLQSVPVFPHRLIFSNFPKDGNLKKMLVGGSLPLAPSALKNPQNVLPEFLIFSLIFLHEYPP